MSTSSIQMARHHRRRQQRREYARSLPKPMPGEQCKTYDEWRAAGFQVMKGEKAMGRNKDGKAQFGRTQVKPRYRGDEDDQFAGEEFDFWNYDGYFDDIGDR